MKRGRRNVRCRGATLVLVTAIGVIVGLLCVSMIQLGYEARIMAVRDVDKVSARCAADAGLAEAFMRMQQKLIREAAWSGPTSPAGGTLEGTRTAQYSYSVEQTPNWSQYEITSTGTCGLTTRTVHAVLGLGSYAEGLGVEETMDAKNGTYFGAVGPAGSRIRIQSNSRETDAMMFRAWVVVDGDVYSGPGSNPDNVIDTKSTTIINGQLDAAAKTMVWPDVTVPTNLTPGPVLTGPGSVPLPQGRYSYTNLTIGNTVPDTVIEITPGATGEPTVVYVADTMILRQGAEVRVLPGASLELYIGEALLSGEATGFSNDTNNAKSLRIYGLPTCDQINLKTKSNTFAVVYAPDADLDLYNSGNFYGSIVAENFEMKNSGNFYFDTRLAQVTIDDLLARFVIARWWEE